MKVPYSWLKEYVNIDLAPEALADKLVKSGFEVESIDYLGKGIDRVRTGRITDIQRHANADKLQVCTVDLKSEQTIIVTAATNISIGDVVPVALDGAELPSGNRIYTSDLRGVTSHGMFCGGDELGVDNGVIEGAEVNGILILPPDTPLGADVKDVLGLNEYVLDISVTANRPDCQSIIGIAREVSAILCEPLKMPTLTYDAVEDDISKYLDVDIAAGDLCTNYYGAVVKNVKIDQSPKWLRDRLRWVDIRSINTIVDITNYVLVEFGQPMHAFDLRYIDGGKICVRRAKPNETLVTLDDKTCNLLSDTLVIADGKKAIGLAGIMGGLNSEIKQDTQDVAFEAARFERSNIRLNSRTIGQRSASSARFEKGVDLGSPAFGMDRALALVSQLHCGDIVRNQIRVDKLPLKKRILTVNVEDINRLLGIEIPVSEMKAILSRLEVVVTDKDSVLTCEIPLHREDLEDFADLAEEIIRIYGYDHIISTLPHVNTVAVKLDRYVMEDRTKALMVGLGCFEMKSFSFINPDVFDKLLLSAEDARRHAIGLMHPISEDFSVMRTTMVPNLLSAASLNLNRKNDEFRMFEISRVFLPKELPLMQLPDEQYRLAIVLCGERESFFTMKGLMAEFQQDMRVAFELKPSGEPYLHPGKSADIYYQGAKIGSYGAVHPSVAAQFEIEKDVFVCELCYDVFQARAQKKYKFTPLPKYQDMQRDIALTVKDEVPAGNMLMRIREICGELLESVEIFDVYKGKQIEDGYKSVAFQLRFRSAERTLVEQEVADIMEKLRSELDREFQAKIRQ